MRSANLLLMTLLVAGCGARSDAVLPSSGAAPEASAAADDQASSAGDEVRLSIVSFEEIEQRIADKRGKVVVMDAWSTSCPPCLQEFHNLVELHKKYGPDQVACISLSFDFEGIGKPEEQQEAVLKFLRQQGATFDNLLSNEESDVLYRKFRLAAVPAVFVYDRAGQLRKRFDNEQAKSKAEAFTSPTSKSASSSPSCSRNSRPSNNRASGRRAGQHVIVQAYAAVTLGHGGKQHVQQRGELPGLQAIEVVLAFAAALDEAGHAQQRQVMAHRRLALVQQIAQGTHVQLAALRQVVQDPQPRFVGQ
jgi:thiol-disulfide isomerase/thioredoxin